MSVAFKCQMADDLNKIFNSDAQLVPAQDLQTLVDPTKPLSQYKSSLSETQITSDCVYYTICNDQEIILSAEEYLNDSTPYDI